MRNEEEIRQKIKGLKNFYINLVIYTFTGFSSIIVWLSMGQGPFWPIWVILGCGICAILQGLNLGQFSQLQELLPFLRPEWEEEQVKSLLPTEPFSQEQQEEMNEKEKRNKPKKTLDTI